MEKMRFVVSDESVNSYGFKVLNSALQIDKFLKNPVCLWKHDRNILPIGVWRGLELINEGWQASLSLDETSDKERQIKVKVDNGVIRTASIGIVVKEFERIDDVMTVTEADLIEISLTDIPSNANAVKLYEQKDSLVELSFMEVEDLFDNYNVDMENKENGDVTQEQEPENKLIELQEQVNELRVLLHGFIEKSEPGGQSEKKRGLSDEASQDRAEIEALKAGLEELKQAQIGVVDLVHGFQNFSNENNLDVDVSDLSYGERVGLGLRNKYKKGGVNA